MATLRIWETVRSTRLPVIRLDERLNHQSVAFTGTAGQSAAFDADTTVISVRADAACAVAVGANPTATTDGYPVEANTLTDFEVEPGQKLSVIAT